MNELIYRPGLEGIIAGETAISTIEGGLRYRGYPIEQLADHTTFDEVAHLIIHGTLPTSSELEAFQGRLQSAAKIDPAIVAALASLPAETPMMDSMRSGASLLAHWDPDIGDDSHDANVRKAERFLAQLPLVMAARHRVRQGLEPLECNPALSFAGNVLWLLHGEQPTETHIRAMDVSFDFVRRT